MYALISGAGCSHAHAGFPNSVLKVQPDGSWTRLADLSAFIQLHPVKNPNPGDFEPDGTFYNLIAADGVLYAVEPNHGEIDAITTSGVVTRLVPFSLSGKYIRPAKAA